MQGYYLCKSSAYTQHNTHFICAVERNPLHIQTATPAQRWILFLHSNKSSAIHQLAILLRDWVKLHKRKHPPIQFAGITRVGYEPPQPQWYGEFLG